MNDYPSQDEVLRALTGVSLPDGEGNIVEAGLISALSAEEEEKGLHVRLVLEVDPAKAEAMETVCERAKKTIEAMEGVCRASVILSGHKAAPNPKAPPKKETQPKKLPDGVKRVMAVASGKGGVGKSTMAVNLAIALAQSGMKVGLLDADVYGPSVPKLVGLEGSEIEEADGKLIPLEAHGIKIMSIGFLVDADAPMIWRGPMVHGAIKQLLYDVAWGELDLLILDMPPGTGDAALSVAQMVPLSGAAIISTPQDIALLDVRKGIAMFERLGVPVLGMIENMSFFECPHCGQRSDIFGHGGAEADAKRLGLDFLGHLPLSLETREKSDKGEPVARTLMIFKEMAEKLKVKL